MLKPELVPSEILEFLRYSAIVGFISTATIVINLNNKAFKRILGENAARLWWLFVLLAVIPLFVFLYLFNLIFGQLFR